MKQISFILGSLNDSHYRKRVEEFVKNGYSVKVFGFQREGQSLPEFPCEVVSLGCIKERYYKARLSLFFNQMRKIAPRCKNTICFYSSLDIALFAKLFIHVPYIYEVCDLTELVINNKFVRNLLIFLNKKCINQSALTIVTSQGFVEYFNSVDQNKMVLIPNKVSPDCPLPVQNLSNKIYTPLKIGFVGVIRFESTYHFIKACQNRDDVEVHLFGIYSDGDDWSSKIKDVVSCSNNMKFYGRFNNPTDLPSIYSQIDLVLCAYTPSPGVVHAEPNKLYEAIYFRKPIIVSDGTFLGRKVESLGVGYSVNSMNEKSVSDFLSHLTLDSYKEKLDYCSKIPQEDCIDKYPFFFEKLNSIFEK